MQQSRPRISVADLLIVSAACLVVFLPIILRAESRIWGSPDSMADGYPTLLTVAECVRRGELPLWNTRIFCGAPLLADPQTQAFYPLNWPFLLLPSTLLYNLIRFAHYPMTAAFAYLFFLTIGLSRRASVFGGVAMSLSGFMVSHPAHFSFVGSTAWTPAVLLAAVKLRDGFRPGWFVFGAGCIALQVYGGHFQFIAYAGVMIFFYVAATTLPADKEAELPLLTRGAPLFRTFLMYVTGSMLAAAQWVLTLGMFFGTKRTTDLTPEEIFTGNNIAEWPLHIFPWWKPPFWSTGGFPEASQYAYPGILALCLAVCAVLVCKNSGRSKEVLPWAVIAVVAGMLSFGFPRILIQVIGYLPPFQWFRDPSRHVYEVGVALACLAAHGIDALFVDGEKNPKTGRFGAILLALLAATAAYTFLGPPGAKAREQIAGMWSGQSLLSFLHSHPGPLLVLMLVGIGIAVMRSHRSGLLRRHLVSVILIGHLIEVSCFIAYWSHHRMGTRRPLELRPLLGEQKLLKEIQTTHHRYMNVQAKFAFPHLANLGVLEDADHVLGFNPLVSRRFLRTLSTVAGIGVLFDPYPIEEAPQILDMLAVRYCTVYTREASDYFSKQRPHWGERVYEAFGDTGRWELVNETSDGRVYRNRHALPRGWCVNEVAWIDPLETERNQKMILVPAEPSRVALVEIEATSPPGAVRTTTFPGDGAIEWLDRRNDRLICRIKGGDCFAVFSEAFHPSWNASIDGEPVPLLRTNGMLMGIVVPPGEHVIELDYDRYPLLIGVSLVALTVLVLLLLWQSRWTRITREK